MNNSLKHIYIKVKKEISNLTKPKYVLSPGQTLPHEVAMEIVRDGFNVRTMLCDDGTSFSCSIVTPRSTTGECSFIEEHFSANDEDKVTKLLLDWLFNGFL